MKYALCFLVVGVSISNALAGIGVGVVLLVCMLRRIALRGSFSAPWPLAILSAVLFLTYAASLIHSEYLGQSIHALFLKYGKYLLLMLAISDGVGEKRVAVNMAVALCLTVTILCWDGFYQFFASRDLLLFREAGRLDVFSGRGEFHFFRITSTFPSANSFASYLVPTLMLGLVLSFFYKAKVGRVAWGKGICLGSLLLCLLLTFSRGGLIACVMGIIFLFVLTRKKALSGIPIVFLMIFLFGNNLYGNRTAQEGAIDPTVETRLAMLKDAVGMLQTHPWTGIGVNTYYRTHEKMHSASIPPSYAHNSYVQMLAEVGILGVMSFAALMIYWFLFGIRAFKCSQDPELKFLLGGTLAAITALLVAALFDNVLFELQPATLFWIFMGYGVALTQIKPTERIP